MRNITTEDFSEAVATGLVLVDFWADWCAPCKAMNPILEHAEKTYEGILKIMKVDADKNPDLLEQHEISSIPTLILFKDGVPQWSVRGATPFNTLAEKINSYI